MRQFLRRSLAARLSAAFLALSIGTLVLVSFVSYRGAERALQERLLSQLAASVNDDVSELTAWHDRQRATLEVIARSVDARPLAAAVANTAVDQRPFPNFPQSLLAADELFLLTVPGARTVRANDAALLGSYHVDQLYYLNGRDSTFTQTVYPSGSTGRPAMTVATPLRDPQGAAIGVLVAHLNLAEMESVLRRPPGDVPVESYLVDRFAEFVSAERFGRDEFTRGVHSLAIDAVVQGGSGVGLYTDYEGKAVIGAWRWIPALQLGVVLESPQDAAFAPARRLVFNALLLGLVATGGLMFGVLAIVRRFTRPVLTVADAAGRVAGGDFSVTAPERGTDELARLAHAFNTMTARLRTLYDELAEQVRARGDALEDAQRSRTLLQDVVNGSATIVLVVDLDDKVRLVNSRLAGFLGVTANDAVGQAASNLLGGTDVAPLLDVLARVDGAPAGHEQEVELSSAEGPHAWQAVAFPLSDADGRRYGTGVIATDLTERARAESERRARDASVQQAQKLESLGVMAGGIAHDFNNLLGAILGNVELARASLENRAELGEALDHIAAASRRAAELTRQMLAYSGRASLKRETVDLREVLNDIVPLVRAAQSKKVTFTVEPMPDPLWVELDPAQLSQVLLNLLTNAAEAIGDAEGTVRVSAARLAQAAGTEALPSGRWIHLQVSDTGPGIPESVRQRIFDPFFTTKESGRGLGLSAVRGIVRSLNGLLTLHSAEDAGTRFDIYLPEVTAPATVEPASAEATAPRPGTVLVVDDEPALRRVSRRVIEGMGLAVVEAADGVEGLERFRTHADGLSLVMLDLTMPRMNGAEVLAEIRRTHPALPVIIASGYDRSAELSGAQRDPATRFLQKPFTISALREAVAATLA